MNITTGNNTRKQVISIVVFGASGDLAKKKTYPALFGLVRSGLLSSPSTRAYTITGYARSEIPLPDFQARVTDRIKLPSSNAGSKESEKSVLDAFKNGLAYLAGSYDAKQDFERLAKLLNDQEQQMIKSLGTGTSSKEVEVVRIFYLALPPNAFYSVCKNLVEGGCANLNQADCRVVVEKPFGRDLASSNQLSAQLAPLFPETSLYRIDHYLGKEMVKSLLTLRFYNLLFSPPSLLWSHHCISSVQITFKEPFGTEGRGGYFDQYGIIRDVLQNHLMQILTIVAMERPVTLSAEDVRDEKVKVLRCIRPILDMDRVLLGQYARSSDGKNPAYQDDETVPRGSNTPTYAAVVVFVDNERWQGVPFILKAGKALNEQKAEVRVQFRDVPGAAFFSPPDPTLGSDDTPTPATSQDQAAGVLPPRNELVVRLQPNEAMYLKFNLKKPGLAPSSSTVISELDLTYSQRYGGERIPDAYEALLLDVIKGDRSNFVRRDELQEAWRIFTPLLHHIEGAGGVKVKGDVKVEKYEYGSRGPMGQTEWVEKWGYQRSRQEYVWSPTTLSPTTNKL